MRLIDFFLAIILGILLLPLIGFIFVVVKLNSRGGAFYIQQRIGQFGKPFLLYKFRTMYLNSDKSGLLTIGNDDKRITSVGSFLRRYKLDELPQLLNVLKGDMSFVGPRPEVEKYVKLYNTEQVKILNIKPGITDEASIQFRHESQILANQSDADRYYIEKVLPHKINLSLPYVLKPTLKQYLSIFIRTIFIVFK